MTLLSDTGIRKACVSGEITITPYDDNMVKPASYDLRLADRVSRMRYKPNQLHQPIINPLTDAPLFEDPITVEDSFIIYPHEFMLATTVERVAISPALGAKVEGKSSLGRHGLMVHVTAGFIDPGWDGHITLELFNLTPYRMCLTPGMPICQMSFTWADEPAAVPYGDPQLRSRYQGQVDPTPSRYWMFRDQPDKQEVN